MNISNKLITNQQQLLSVKQIQSLDILAYTNQELDYLLTHEYLENPLLDHETDKGSDIVANIEDMYEKSSSYKDHYLKWEEEDTNRRDDISSPPVSDLHNDLIGQLTGHNLSKKQWNIVDILIQCLEPDGYFTYEIDEIVKMSGYPAEEITSCLNLLKELEPTGIFSRDLSECLYRQLLKLGITEPDLLTLVTRHLPDIMNGQIGSISRKLKLSTAKVKEYILLLSKLSPRPLPNQTASTAEQIIPDVLVTRRGKDYEVELNDHWIGEYKYNDYYLKMMREADDPKLAAYFRERFERARFIFDCIEQRRNTIRQVVYSILSIQQDYFEQNGPLRPMTLEDIALRNDIHASTVSRAIKGKYMQYHKTVLIKDLFTTAMPADAGAEDVSSAALKEKIRQLISEESPDAPLSDGQIADLLKIQGFPIARRTVAKYRIQLGLLDSRQRKFYK